MKAAAFCLVVATAFNNTNSMSAQTPAASVIARVDHLVYATPDLERGVAEMEKLLGIKATPGGRHPGRGTRNALISLGPKAYLEIIGPDAEQPAPAQPRTFGIDDLTASRLVTWAANGRDLEGLHKEAASNGIALGPVANGSRQRPDGVLLSWQFTSPLTILGDGIVPFFIDWKDSPHPAAGSAQGARLIALRAEHPDPERVAAMLKKLGLDVPVARAEKPALIATIESPRGRVELR
jgi:hypothetical protein